MKNILKYKGYYSTVEYSVEDKVLYGKIEGIKDLITYESDSVKSIEKEFKKAVDDYLAFCKDMKKEPEKPYNGVFNIRIKPETHKKAAIDAIKEGISLNQFIANAIEKAVY